MLGTRIQLHRGTLNVRLKEAKAEERLRPCRLGEPIMQASEQDPHRHCFHEVRLFHGTLGDEGVLAFLWRPATIGGAYRGCVELAAETIEGLTLGDQIEVDFSAALVGGDESLQPVAEVGPRTGCLFDGALRGPTRVAGCSRHTCTTAC